nr:enoyl-CoA hydratase-related protein [Nocardia carnea]
MIAVGDGEVNAVSDGELIVADHDGIRTVTLNRPHRKNAMTWAMWRDLADVLRDTGMDRSVRALVLTGAGGAFCSGADISVPDARHPMDKMRIFSDLALQLYELPTPTVAKVTGVAVGAGWNLALGCDLVVATPDASFAQIFARRGLSLDLGGSWLLPKLIGLQQAKRLALLAETIDAAQAEALGLVTWIVAANEIGEFTADLAARLAAGPPVALAQTKALLNAGADATLREALAAESRAQGVNFATADAPEAYRAFAEKRAPHFTGEWSLPPAGNSVRPEQPKTVRRRENE